jgi:hypothetical protein
VGRCVHLPEGNLLLNCRTQNCETVAASGQLSTNRAGNQFTFETIWRIVMKKLTAIAIAAIAMFMFAPQSAEAQFHRGFGGPGFGGSGFSISIGNGFGPGFGNFGPRFGPGIGPAFGPAVGFNRGFGVGFGGPIYRPVPVNSFYRGGFNNGFHGGFHRGGGIYYGGGRRGCGW